LPILETDEGAIVTHPQRKLPTTFSELKAMVGRSKGLSRDGFGESRLSEHAERLEYSRIFDGAVAAVEKAMGQAR
jgi:hypothetical protein